MLTGRQIDEGFLDRWECDLCSSLQHGAGRPFMLVQDGPLLRQYWLIDPILASVCAHQPVLSGYFMWFEPQGTSRRLWIGVGVTNEPVLGGFLSSSFEQPGFVASIRPLFRKLDATAFMGQGGWVRSTMTSHDGTSVMLTASLLDQVAATYAPALPGAEFLVTEVYRVYDTADDMELDVERVTGRLIGDFGTLYNGLFPREAE